MLKVIRLLQPIFLFLLLPAPSFVYGADDPRIALNPSMVKEANCITPAITPTQTPATLSKPLTSRTLLVDEQSLNIIYGKQISPPNPNPPISKWFAGWPSVATYPIYACIDLGNYYTITALAIFDSNGEGSGTESVNSVEFWSGKDNSSQPIKIGSHDQKGFNIWQKIPAFNITVARYVRVVIRQPDVVPTEIALFGKINRPPVITTDLSPISLQLLSSKNLMVTATDPDNDAVTLSLTKDEPKTGTAEFISFTNSGTTSATIDINPTVPSQMSPRKIFVTATDTKGLSTTQTIDLNVIKVDNTACAPNFNAGPDETANFKITRALGRGINFGAYLEAPREGDWSQGGLLNETHFRRAHEAGFCTIRLPVRFSNHLSNGYTIDANYTTKIDSNFLTRVDDAVSWARAYGMNVIIDLHHFRQLDAQKLDANEIAFKDINGRLLGIDPLLVNPQQADYDAKKDDYVLLDKIFMNMWDQIAKHYEGKYPNDPQVLFELINEPGKRFRQATVLNKLHLDTINIIRAAKAQPTNKRFIVIEPVNAKADDPIKYIEKVGLPADYSDIILSIHNYDPQDFTTSDGSAGSVVVATCCTAAQITNFRKRLDDTRARFTGIYTTGSFRNVPVFVGEFGSINLRDEKSRLNFTRLAKCEMEKRSLNWVYWNFALTKWGFYYPEKEASSTPSNTMYWNANLKTALFQSLATDCDPSEPPRP